MSRGRRSVNGVRRSFDFDVASCRILRLRTAFSARCDCVRAVLLYAGRRTRRRADSDWRGGLAAHTGHGGLELIYLSRLQVSGLRAYADQPIDVSIPGRFAVLLGANSAGKTTISDAAYLAHRKTFPRLPRPSASGLGGGDRFVDVEYRFAED